MGLRVPITRQHCGLAMALALPRARRCGSGRPAVVLLGRSSADNDNDDHDNDDPPAASSRGLRLCDHGRDRREPWPGAYRCPGRYPSGGNGWALLGVGTYPDAIAVTPDELALTSPTTPPTR